MSCRQERGSAPIRSSSDRRKRTLSFRIPIAHVTEEAIAVERAGVDGPDDERIAGLQHFPCPVDKAAPGVPARYYGGQKDQAEVGLPGLGGLGVRRTRRLPGEGRGAHMVHDRR